MSLSQSIADKRIPVDGSSNTVEIRITVDSTAVTANALAIQLRCASNRAGTNSAWLK